MLFLLPNKEARRPSSALDLLDFAGLVLGGTMEVERGPLRNSFEHHATVSDFTASAFKWERVDTAHAAPVTKDIAVFIDLQQERPSYFILTVFLLQVFYKEDASFVIELDFAIDKIWSCNLNGLTSGFLRNHIDGFLWKCVPEQRSFAPAATHHDVQRLAPAAPILLLFVRPFANQHH